MNDTIFTQRWIKEQKALDAIRSTRKFAENLEAMKSMSPVIYERKKAR